MSNADDVSATSLDEQVFQELRGRTSKAEAITSGELADRLNVGDAEANPRTRELVRDVMESHDLPVVSCHAGYYVADSLVEIEDELDSLDGRIAGIEQRKERLVGAYNRRGYDE